MSLFGLLAGLQFGTWGESPIVFRMRHFVKNCLTTVPAPVIRGKQAHEDLGYWTPARARINCMTCGVAKEFTSYAASHLTNLF